MKDELIRKDELYEKLLSIPIDGEEGRTIEKIINMVKDAPAVAAAPVVTAVWRHIGGDEWLCTACCNVISTEGSWEHPYQKYCDQCGAKITGVEME